MAFTQLNFLAGYFSDMPVEQLYAIITIKSTPNFIFSGRRLEA
jgi:hypothetical protein